MSEYCVLFYLIKNDIFKKEKRRVFISTPRILDIKYTDNGNFVDPKHLKYFKEPPISAFPLNLNIGFEDYKYRCQEYYLNHSQKKIEKYLMEHDGYSYFKNSSKQQICTTRNFVKNIMMTPYRMAPSQCNNWTVKAIKFQNVIYVVNEKDNQNTKAGTYHFKLHQYCLSDSPDKLPNTDEAIDENNQTWCIYRTTIDDFELLYSAEIVGVNSDIEIKDFKNEATLNECHFIMIKLLTETAQNNQNGWKSHPKMFGTWIQAYFTCTEKIYVGLRTQDGFVCNKLRSVETKSLPEYQIWKPQICKRFLRDFLENVGKIMAKIDSPYTVYEFKFDSIMQMIKYRVFEGKTDHSFLSEEFIQYMQKK